MADNFMFDHLPLEIREMIFSRVRYVDRFETARVSKEWWMLTMASFERVVHSKDGFLLDQVKFCNEMMPKEEPWEWWMLMEFTKSRKLYLDKGDLSALMNEDNGRIIKYFRDKKIHVKHLTIGKNPIWIKDNLILPPNLNQLFPHLILLELSGAQFEDSSALVLTSNLRCLKLFDVRMSPRRSLDTMLADPSKLKVLVLTQRYSDVYFNGQNCKNLTRLSISAICFRANDTIEPYQILKNILDQNKGLKSVSLEYFTITSEWHNMFPSNVVKLQLKYPHLSLSLQQFFGSNVLYERMTFFHICEDWKSVAQFKSRKMAWGKHWEAEYQIRYVCEPAFNSEEIEVYSKKESFALNDVISPNNGSLVLTTLTYGAENFQFDVPGTVRNLKVVWPSNSRAALVHQDPSVLETLFLDPSYSSKIYLNGVSNMNNLRKLHFRKCDRLNLERILVSCTSLEELKLGPNSWNIFKDMASDIKSVSVKRLRLRDCNETFENILKHFPSLNTLYLEGHHETGILKSDVNAISHLQYFKALFRRNTKAAVHLSSLEFPTMFLACCQQYDVYAASTGMELLNEISVNVSENNNVNAKRSFVLNGYANHETVSLVYAKNIPTRFLRNFPHVVNTVKNLLLGTNRKL